MRSRYILKSCANNLITAIVVSFFLLPNITNVALAIKVEIDNLTKINALIDGSVSQIKDVVLVVDGFRVSASKAVYDQANQSVVLENATLIQDPLVISAEYASIRYFDISRLDFSKVEIDFNFASLFDAKTETHIKARLLKRLDDKNYYAEDVVLTQCKDRKTDLTFHAKNIHYEVDNYAYGYHTWIRFYSLPVFYLPVYGFPTINKRQSGFLPPHLRYVPISKGDGYGLMFKMPYFIEFGKSHDITFDPEVYVNRGLALGVEYNYAFRKWQRGKIYFWYISEFIKERKISEEVDMTSASDKTPNRYHASFYYSDRIGDKLKILVTAEKNSDNELKKDYKDGNKSINSQDALFTNISFFGDNYYTYFDSRIEYSFLRESRYNKTTDPRSLHQNKISFKYKINNFAKYGVRFNITPQIKSFSRKQGWRGIEFKLLLGLKYQKNIGFLKNQFEFKNATIFYTTDYVENLGSSIYRKNNNFLLNKPQINFKSYFDLKKEGTLQNLNTKYLTKIRPFLNLQWRPDLDQRNLIDSGNQTLNNRLDDYHLNGQKFSDLFLEPAKLALLVGFDYSFYTIDKNKNLNKNINLKLYATFNLLRSNTLSQKNRFKGPTIEEPYQETKLGQKLLPLRLDFEYISDKNFELYWKSRYELSSYSFLEYKTGAKFYNKNKDNLLDVFYHYNGKNFRSLDGKFFPKKNQIGTHLKFDLVSNLKISLKQNFNFLRQSLFENSNFSTVKGPLDFFNIDLSYINCCYTFNFGYQEEISLRQNLNKNEEFTKKTFYLSISLFRSNIPLFRSDL